MFFNLTKIKTLVKHPLEMVQLLFFKSLYLLSFFIFFCSTKPIFANTEVRALMDIKTSLDPENKVLQTWKNESEPCKSEAFIGVSCNEHQRVVNISLQGRELTGKLSPAIGDLKSLSGLYLHYNSISGQIPKQIGELTQLTDLYLNVNNLSGSLPTEISQMTNLQVVDLCCNHLTGAIPEQLGSLSNLESLSLQNNQFNGSIPPSLGSLKNLKRLDLSYNHLSGIIPETLANIQPLQLLDLQNNSLSGAIPTPLKRLDAGFSYANNTNLCGAAFHTLRPCTAFDSSSFDINTPQPFSFMFQNHSTSRDDEQSKASLQTNCTPTCLKSISFLKIAIVARVIAASVLLAVVGFLTFFRFRRHKQKIGITAEPSESRVSTDQANESYCSRSASPLVTLAYSVSRNPLTNSFDSRGFSQEVLQNFRYNLAEVECATQYFSEANVLGRGNFSTVYKAVLRDGSVVAVKSIGMSSCQSEEDKFMTGLNLLVSLRHENLIGLRGFCSSRGRGEWFFVYDFAPKVKLLRYLDVSDGSDFVLPWSTRVNIVKGIAKGLCYLHKENASKPMVVHQNLSAEKIVIDNQYNPLILDSGLHKILADDTIFSALKVSAAMGYLAPEYITTGRLTEKSDVYAFGMIILNILSGKKQLTNALKLAAKNNNLEDFIDLNLHGKFSIAEASKLVRLALSCTHELPEERPSVEIVVQELDKRNSGS